MADLSSVTNEELTRQLLKNLATIGPFFILVLTLDGDSINVQAANETIEELPEAVPFTKDDTEPLTDAIETYIKSSTLNTIYNAAAPSAVAVPESNDKIIDDFMADSDNNTKTYTQLGFVNLVDDSNNPIDHDNTITATVLKNPKNKAEVIKIITTLSGGSRSRKHRRRHKQKKNKNTKRRNRK